MITEYSLFSLTGLHDHLTTHDTNSRTHWHSEISLSLFSRHPYIRRRKSCPRSLGTSAEPSRREHENRQAMVVGNVAQRREALISRGVEVSKVEEHDQGVKYASFSDPDGNTWALQEMPWRSSEF